MPGKLEADILKTIIAALPLDLTFVDETDIIRYYSDYRIFKRTPEIIGTKVQNCHRPESRDHVNAVIDDLRSGNKSVSEFWVDKDDRRVRVRYIGLKDTAGKYVGMIEAAEWADN